MSKGDEAVKFRASEGPPRHPTTALTLPSIRRGERFEGPRALEKKIESESGWIWVPPPPRLPPSAPPSVLISPYILPAQPASQIPTSLRENGGRRRKGQAAVRTRRIAEGGREYEGGGGEGSR